MRAHAAVTLGLITLCVAVFAQVRDHDFVDWDDRIVVVENASIQQPLDAASLAHHFSHPIQGNWIPLTLISLQVDHALYGLSPGGFHATNLLLHLLAALALYAALFQMTREIAPSAFVAAVFAIHPLHVESVVWAAERKDVLSGLFFSLTLLAYAGWTQRPGVLRYTAVLAALALGLMSKSMLVTLPFVLLLLDLWPLRRLQSADGDLDAARVRRAVIEKLPLLIPIVLVSVITYQLQRDHGSMAFGQLLELRHRLPNALTSYVAYLVTAFWPTGLAAFYPHPMETFGVRAAGSAALLVTLTFAALRCWRTRPYLSVGWLWFLGTLVPVIGLVQVGEQARADRYMYLPLIGLALAVAWGAKDLARDRHWPTAAPAGLAIAAVLALAATAHRQVGHWRDSVALFSHATAVTRDNAEAHYRLGVAYQELGQPAKARAQLAEVLRIVPDSTVAAFSLAHALREQGDCEAAVPYYDRTIARDREHGLAYLERTLCLVELERFADAGFQLARSLATHPDRADLQLAAARILRARGDADGALRHARRALTLDPSFGEAAREVVWALAASPVASLRRPQEAVSIATATLGRPPDVAGLEALAVAQASAGQFEAAVRNGELAATLASQAGAGDRADAIRERVARFRDGEPYVGPPPED